MQGQDHTEVTTQSQEPVEKPAEEEEADLYFASVPVSPSSRSASSEERFDWLALGVVILIAGLFALAARLNPQPSTSIAPAAVLSATGCGLLVTAIRKLHTSNRPGLFEAALAGLFLALFQFFVALSYPNVLYSLSNTSDQRFGFLTTWALIAVFSLLFSIVGATLGHLAFAPMRPLPPENRKSKLSSYPSVIGEEEIKTQVPHLSDKASQQRLYIGYFVSVLLLGLAPTVVGYVFSAAFDYMLNLNHFFPGPYPTLRLLSGLLPWQIPISTNLNSNNPTTMIFFIWQLWRFPVFLGNPTIFDVQALEPYIFNSAALGILLLTLRDPQMRASEQSSSVRWPIYVLLELLLGLLLVLPANLWIVRGLEGLLQSPVIAIQIRTLHILDQFTFTLNLFSGPLICLGLGVLLRLFNAKRGKK
jgi:uncharacterized membrane protein HdeD (DUF308 family)